ncbi:MAG: hypothetical protein Q7V63_06775 [Gammaproteobacteria bacterium]|nr:hypothetical protein [Gammaproteobacteria bacterium]
MYSAQTVQSSNLKKALDRIFGGATKKGISGIDSMLDLAGVAGNSTITLADLQRIVNSRPSHSLTRSAATRNLYSLIKKGTFPLDKLADMNCNDIFDNQFSLRKECSFSGKYSDEPTPKDHRIKFWRGDVPIPSIDLNEDELRLMAALGQINNRCIKTQDLKVDSSVSTHWAACSDDVSYEFSKENKKMGFLEWAWDHRDYESVALLLQLNADIYTRMSDGETFYDRVLSCYVAIPYEVMKALFSSDQAKLEIKHSRDFVYKALDSNNIQVVTSILDVLDTQTTPEYRRSLHLMDRALANYKKSSSNMGADPIRLLHERGYTLTAGCSDTDQTLFKAIIESSLLSGDPAPKAACGAGEKPTRFTGSFEAAATIELPPSSAPALPATASPLTPTTPGL